MSKLLDSNGVEMITHRIKSYAEKVNGSLERLPADPNSNKEKFTVVVQGCPVSKLRITFGTEVVFEGDMYWGQDNAKVYVVDPGITVTIEALAPQINFSYFNDLYYDAPQDSVQRFITEAGVRRYVEFEYTAVWDGQEVEDDVIIIDQSGTPTITGYKNGCALDQIMKSSRCWGVKPRVDGTPGVILCPFMPPENLEDILTRQFYDGTPIDKRSICQSGYRMWNLPTFSWRVEQMDPDVSKVYFHFGPAPSPDYEQWDSNRLIGYRAGYWIQRLSDGKNLLGNYSDHQMYQDSLYHSYSDFWTGNTYQFFEDLVMENEGWDMLDWDARCVILTAACAYFGNFNISNKFWICDGMFHLGSGRHEYLPRYRNWVENYKLNIRSKTGKTRVLDIAPSWGGYPDKLYFGRHLDMAAKSVGSRWTGQYWIENKYSFVSVNANNGFPSFSFDASTEKRRTRYEYYGPVYVEQNVAEFCALPHDGLGTYEEELAAAKVTKEQVVDNGYWWETYP